MTTPTMESLPVQDNHDLVRDGLPGAAVFQLTAGQDIPRAVREPVQTRFGERMKSVREVYGVGAALRRVAEARKMQEFHRFPGMPSSFLGLDITTGNDKTIGVQDVYGDVADAPVCDMFATLEKAREN